MTLNPSIASEIQKLAPSAVIELFELDVTNLGGDVLRFHAGTNGLSQNIVWQGQTYVRFPIKVTGFEFQGQGQFPRPRLQASNALSAITEILLQYEDLLTAKLTRKRTCVKFLDAVNFPGGVNPTADDTAAFNDDVYYIDRKSAEDRDVVEFELASSLDLAGLTLPRRQIIQNLCTWKYRGAECGYTGGPIFDFNDNVIVGASTTEGQAVLDTYAAMLAAKTALDAAEATLVSATRAKDPACEIKYLATQYGYSAVTGVPPYGRVPSVTYGIIVEMDRFFNVLSTSAIWNSSAVSIGINYRQGRLRDTPNNFDQGVTQNYLRYWWVYEIEHWDVDSAACTSATSALSSATSDYSTKLTAYNDAVIAHASAVSAIPPNDPLFSLERCGKRLTSCKARFGATNPLPFGGFPAAGLIQ